MRQNEAHFLSAKIIDYGLQLGHTHVELARLARVRQVTLRNWVAGHPARGKNLARLIHALGLTSDNGYKVLFGDKGQIEKHWDAKRLYHAAKVEALWKQLEMQWNKLIGIAKQIDEEIQDQPNKTFIKIFGKKLIDIALNGHTSAMLFLIPIGIKWAKNNIDQSSYEMLCKEIDAELDDLCFSHSRRNIRVDLALDANAKLESIPEYAPLTDAESSFLERSSSRIESIALYKIWWGHGCAPQFPQFHWLVEWISDVDGQYVVNTLFSKIRLQMEKNIPQIQFEVHEGYFVTDEEDATHSEDIDAYSDDEFRFVYGEGDVFYEHTVVPLSANTVKLFFAMFGYRIKFACNNPKRGVHNIIIKW